MEDLYVLSFFCRTEYKDLYKEILEEIPKAIDINCFWNTLNNIYKEFFKNIKPYRVYQNTKNIIALFKIDNLICLYREFTLDNEQWIMTFSIPKEEWENVKIQEKEESLFDL